MTPEAQLELSTRIAESLVGRPDDIDDLAQDGIVAMLEAAPFNGRGDEEGYLGWRIRNGVVDSIRRRSGRSGQRATFACIDEIPEPYCAPTQNVECEDEERRMRVKRAIAALPAREVDLVRSHYYKDQCQSEIARALGLSSSRVSQLLARARRRLRTALSEEER